MLLREGAVSGRRPNLKFALGGVQVGAGVSEVQAAFVTTLATMYGNDE
jgi:hypothetical protein